MEGTIIIDPMSSVFNKEANYIKLKKTLTKAPNMIKGKHDKPTVNITLRNFFKNGCFCKIEITQG